MDSGLPHDDLTPRSDSFSTVSSSASPPDQQMGPLNPTVNAKEQHRKSNSLDEINLNNTAATVNPQNRGQPWKCSSLQRGQQPIPVGQEVPVPQPPMANGQPIYATAGTMVNPNSTRWPSEGTQCHLGQRCLAQKRKIHMDGA